MRDGLQSAVNAGVNLVNLGANEGYTRARVTYKGDIRLFVYRSIAKDPVKDPTRATTTFRQSHQYESRLMGSMYACLRTTATGVKKMSSWVFAKSGGRTLNRIVDLENDAYFPQAGPPNAHVSVLAGASFKCAGRKNVPATWAMTYYNSPISGAGVVNVGTMGWICNLNRSCLTHKGDSVTRGQVAVITRNILSVFQQGVPAENLRAVSPSSPPASLAGPATAALPEPMPWNDSIVGDAEAALEAEESAEDEAEETAEALEDLKGTEFEVPSS